jgi:DNA topoisomerase III
MKTLYLAEKPAQARDIAAVLGVAKRAEGFIELRNGDKVTWAIGHLLELAPPEAYNEAWGGYWKWDQLPMIPAAWKYQVNRKTSKQLAVIKSLLKEADRVVIATDAAREGELIAREIMEYCKFKGKVDRFWTSSLVEDDIRAALRSLKPGAETYPLYEAALARSHSDWLVGLPGTRAATLAAQIRGDYFPLGRVKTPTLALLVRRELEIRGFTARAYYELDATVRTASGATLTLSHAPGAEHRITSKDVALALQRKAEGASGPLQVESSPGSESPPLPFSLPALQKEANAKLGFTARTTLTLAQALYEKKALTYPRTDCRYLAQSQIAEIPDVLAAVKLKLAQKVGALEALGVTARPGTFNDAKLLDHHAIVPTKLALPLEGTELQLYTLVATRYLQTLGPDCKFTETKVLLDANGVPFKTSGRVVTSPGWTVLKDNAS